HGLWRLPQRARWRLVGRRHVRSRNHALLLRLPRQGDDVVPQAPLFPALPGVLVGGVPHARGILRDQGLSPPHRSPRSVACAGQGSGERCRAQRRNEIMRTEILFVGLPYAAAALLVVGMAVRFAMARPRIVEARAEAKIAWRRYRGGLVWRAALLAVA